MSRTTLALPIDTARLFDSTVSVAQIDANTFQNSTDDDDLLLSMIEDAENEFHRATNSQMKIGTVGLPGTRESYEQATYKLSGHKLTKGTFTGVWTEYLPEQKSMPLEKERVLPFDPDAGDEVYIYRGLDDGLGDGWENVTDAQGEMWDILDHQNGMFTFSPIETAEYLMDYHTGAVTGTVPSFLKKMRFALTYRYGGLGGSRDQTAEVTLDTDITDTETGTVAIADVTGVPSTSEVVVKIDREYLSVTFDPDAGQMDILERGVRGTQEAAHDADVTVSYTPPSIRKAVAARAAEQLITSGRYQDWLPDTEDDIDKSDMLDEFTGYWEGTVAALSG